MRKGYQKLRPQLSWMILMTLASMNGAYAFEQETHAVITHRAFLQSKLNSAELLSRLGLSGTHPLGAVTPYAMQGYEDGIQIYIDVSSNGGATTEVARFPFPYENDMIQQIGKANFFEVDPLSIESWLQRGAIREDDNPFEPLTPNDAPPPTVRRPLHHFFDPVNNIPLDATGTSLFDADIHKNPDWAIGSADVFNAPNTPEDRRRNHFTIFDAREAMWRALTATKKDGTIIYGAGLGEFGKEALRRSYWATVFRSLGDVVHLLQDMAQPQHTRNEAHSGRGPDVVQTYASGHASFFEIYMKARSLAGAFAVIENRGDSNEVVMTQMALLKWADYPPPRFDSYQRYWSLYPGSPGSGGTGLADYSNRGFFTAANNLGDTKYQNPTNSVSGYNTEDVPFTFKDGSRGALTYLTAPVNDAVTGSSQTIKMTRRGLWNKWSLSAPAYVLDRNTYDEMARLLLPRAAGYSAGLLDYFFRGKMEISLPDAGVYGFVDHSKFATGAVNYPTDAFIGAKGFDKIKLKLKNTTDAIIQAGGSAIQQEMPQGTLVAVLKFHRNNCYKDDLSGELGPVTAAIDSQVLACRSQYEDIVVSEPLQPQAVPLGATAGDGIELTFNFPDKQMPLNAWDVYLQVVYRGKLGSEDDAVVVATKNISEPTYFTFHSDMKWDGQSYSLLNMTPPLDQFGSEYRMSFGSSQAPVIMRPPVEIIQGQSWYRLVSPYFVRFATLQDLDHPLSLNIQCSDCESVANPFIVPPYIAQNGSSGQGLFQGLSEIAGVKRWQGVVPYIDIQNTNSPRIAPTAEDLTRIPALPDRARYPVPMSVIGW